MPDQKIQWHPGFFAGIELEFKQYPVDIEKEYQLTRGPLQIDLLIIKKLTDDKIDNEIGNIFRRHNIIEYKSPDDELSIDVFYKVQAYASLYKASGDTVNAIPAEDISVTLFRDTYPKSLIERLKESGSVIHEEYPGIYYVEGNCLFPTQIVVSGQFSEGEHSAFQILSRKAPRKEVIAFLQHAAGLTDPGDRSRVDSILQVSVSANHDLYQDIHKEDIIMCEALRDLMKEDFDRTLMQGFQQGEQQGKQQGLELGRQQGLELGRQQGVQQGMQQGETTATVNSILSLMKNFNWSSAKSMDALSIPEEKRAYYSELINKPLLP